MTFIHSQVPVYLGIALFGALGASSRFALESLFPFFLGKPGSASFPWAPFVTNVLGSAIAAFFFLFTTSSLPGSWRVPLVVGFAGSFTTFSRLSLDSYEMLLSGRYGQAFINLFLGPIAGVLAVAVVLGISTFLGGGETLNP